MAIDGIVLAAGLSSRAGVFKMTLDVGGRMLIHRTIDGMACVCDRIIVVGGYRIEDLRAALAGRPGVSVVLNDEYREGMYSSVKAGIRHVRSDRFFLIPGDCPYVGCHVYTQLLQADTEVVIPTYEGRKGHPILLQSSLIAPILADSEQVSLRNFIESRNCALVDVAEEGILRDIDTVNDLR